MSDRGAAGAVAASDERGGRRTTSKRRRRPSACSAGWVTHACWIVAIAVCVALAFAGEHPIVLRALSPGAHEVLTALWAFPVCAYVVSIIWTFSFPTYTWVWARASDGRVVQSARSPEALDRTGELRDADRPDDDAPVLRIGTSMAAGHSILVSRTAGTYCCDRTPVPIEGWQLEGVRGPYVELRDGEGSRVWVTPALALRMAQEESVRAYDIAVATTPGLAGLLADEHAADLRSTAGTMLAAVERHLRDVWPTPLAANAAAACHAALTTMTQTWEEEDDAEPVVSMFACGLGMIVVGIFTMMFAAPFLETRSMEPYIGPSVLWFCAAIVLVVLGARSPTSATGGASPAPMAQPTAAADVYLVFLNAAGETLRGTFGDVRKSAQILAGRALRIVRRAYGHPRASVCAAAWHMGSRRTVGWRVRGVHGYVHQADASVTLRCKGYTIHVPVIVALTLIQRDDPCGAWLRLEALAAGAHAEDPASLELALHDIVRRLSTFDAEHGSGARWPVAATIIADLRTLAGGDER